jgi:hypothetical protein
MLRGIIERVLGSYNLTHAECMYLVRNKITVDELIEAIVPLSIMHAKEELRVGKKK